MVLDFNNAILCGRYTQTYPHPPPHHAWFLIQWTCPYAYLSFVTLPTGDGPTRSSGEILFIIMYYKLYWFPKCFPNPPVKHQYSNNSWFPSTYHPTFNFLSFCYTSISTIPLGWTPNESGKGTVPISWHDTPRSLSSKWIYPDKYTRWPLTISASVPSASFRTLYILMYVTILREAWFHFHFSSNWINNQSHPDTKTELFSFLHRMSPINWRAHLRCKQLNFLFHHNPLLCHPLPLVSQFLLYTIIYNYNIILIFQQIFYILF